MRLLHTRAFLAIAFVGGCVSNAQTTPEYGDYGDNYAGLSTGPGDEYGPSSWNGPPGGSMDPGYGYEDPSLAQSPSAQSADPMYGGAMYGGQAYGGAWVDPTAPTGEAGEPVENGAWAGATAEVTDAEIDMTLDAYGEWVEDADYGRVWRPYTTVVGAEFTPYESCGSWVFTDYGWTFQSCDAWSWGWLPFHFGRWVYLDDSWCWSRDYTWGPAWVEWRHGGGYVGWRPMRPTRQIRDHRDRFTGPAIRDHRRGKHDEWRFNSADQFGRGPIRPSRSIGVREGLRDTTAVAQPPIRGEVRGRVGSVMAGRLRDHQRFEARTRGAIGQSTRGYQPSQPSGGVAPTRGYNNSVGAVRGNAPYRGTYNPSVVAPNPNGPTWQSNRGGYRYTPPTSSGSQGGYRYNPPTSSGSRGGYRYNPPTNGYRTPPTNNGGYRYNPPTGAPNGYRNNASTNNGGYRAPSNSGYRYNPPSSSGSSGGYRYNPPSRPSPSWGGSRNSAPAPSSRPSSNYGGSRSSSPAPSRSYSAPSRSYSAPSRSSYSAPSRSSSSSSGSSRSSSSSSSSRSSSSSSSSGGSRGGRHR